MCLRKLSVIMHIQWGLAESLLPCCCLPFEEDSLREGEWVCHEYMNSVFNLGKCGNEPARYLTWGGGGGGGGGGEACSFVLAIQWSECVVHGKRLFFSPV